MRASSVRPASGHVSRGSLTPLAFVLVALALFAGGGHFLWLRVTTDARLPLLATSAVVLLLLSAAQLHIAWRVWRLPPTRHSLSLVRGRAFWLWLSAGVVVCYALNLLWGESRTTPHLFCMALACWTTAAQLPLLVSPARRNHWLARFNRPALRAAGWSLYALLMAPLLGEVALRGYALALDEPISSHYLAAQLKLPPGTEVKGRVVNEQGYWDKEFEPSVAPGVFRVAVVGDDLTLCGDARTNFVSQIERQVPGLEIYNFGMPYAGPREYAAQVGHEIAPYRPDLVLTVVSVSSDITQELPLPDVFDRRWLYLYQFSATLLRDPQSPLSQARLKPAAPESQEAYLRRGAEQLAVCRTPIDASMHQRWREVFGHLDALVRECQQRQLPVAIVVAPGEFQVNAALRSTLQRRAGYRAEELDLALPQRRFAQYAQKRQLQMLDLLPYLQTSPQPTFERNQRTFSDHGNDLAADVIGHWMRSHYGHQIAATHVITAAN